MAPSMSLGVRPASSMASRAASEANIRSERSGCWPATTPRPTIAYLPDDGCLGTILVPPVFLPDAYCDRQAIPLSSCIASGAHFDSLERTFAIVNDRQNNLEGTEILQ